MENQMETWIVGPNGKPVRIVPPAANDNHPQEDAFMAGKPLQIEEGKWYRRRDGDVVGPVEPYDDDTFVWCAGDETFRINGQWALYDGERDYDLIEEATPPVDAALTTGFAPMWSPPDVKAAIADEAKRIVTGARRAAYGAPEDNFARIAAYWNAYAQCKGWSVVFTAADVSPMMRGMKEARLVETPDHRDSFVDLVGYTLTGAEINGVAA